MRRDATFRSVLKAVSREAGWEILRAVAEGPTRFTHLERSTRVSPRTLSERLKELTELGLIERVAYPEVPPRVEYTLTETGRVVIEVLGELERILGAFEERL